MGCCPGDCFTCCPQEQDGCEVCCCQPSCCGSGYGGCGGCCSSCCGSSCRGPSGCCGPVCCQPRPVCETQ
ncbi:keratin-associated protein 17-1 [Eschrichtius robustus]|uniref:keratin-associated protein 17-1 n=1 Tax=Eschrichtius robustus TaxID=9764 RepID=UPI0035C24344